MRWRKKTDRSRSCFTILNCRCLYQRLYCIIRWFVVGSVCLLVCLFCTHKCCCTVKLCAYIVNKHEHRHICKRARTHRCTGETTWMIASSERIIIHLHYSIAPVFNQAAIPHRYQYQYHSSRTRIILPASSDKSSGVRKRRFSLEKKIHIIDVCSCLVKQLCNIFEKLLN